MRSIEGERAAHGLKIGLVVSRFHEQITDRLLEGSLDALKSTGIDDENIVIVKVPGAFELAGAAAKLAGTGQVDAIVCLGAVVRGETAHFEYVSAAAQQGILKVGLDHSLPVTFGVLTTEDVEQAMERSGGDWGNKGFDVALDAVEMANLYAKIV